MFKKIKQFICKILHIKACQCDDKPVVMKKEVKEEVTVESKVDHCVTHTRFKVSCPACVVAATQ